MTRWFVQGHCAAISLYFCLQNQTTTNNEKYIHYPSVVWKGIWSLGCKVYTLDNAYTGTEHMLNLY